MRRKIVYVVNSEFKQEENRIFCRECRLKNGRLAGEEFEFEFYKSPVLQVLEVDIETLVRKAANASYEEVRRPCVVEYAGLIFDRFANKSYPGGLTKAMWNALGSRFVTETNCGGEKAIARAAVAYCDGKRTIVFTGETSGIIAKRPRGDRKFYWDTIFQPDDPNGGRRRTYSQIVKQQGLEYKMRVLSQSTKAMRALLEYLVENPSNGLWR